MIITYTTPFRSKKNLDFRGYSLEPVLVCLIHGEEFIVVMPHAIDLHVSSIDISLMFCIEAVQEAVELRLQFILGLDAIQIELVMWRLIVLLKLTDERDDVPLDAIGVSDFVLIVKILLDIDLVEEIPCDLRGPMGITTDGS